MRETPLPPADDMRIAFVLTSCARFDLLQETLATFLEFNTAPIHRYLVIEDSGDEHVREVVARFDAPIEVHVNDPPIGQLASIDLAYAAVDAPFIFHCEDDWRFFRSGFVEESLELLGIDAMISAVLSRRFGQNRNHDLLRQSPIQSHNGVRYRKAPVSLGEGWLGYSFNPGLRRLSDYRRIGCLAKFGSEKNASAYFKTLGMSVATLEDPACETTGHGRHVEKNLP